MKAPITVFDPGVNWDQLVQVAVINNYGSAFFGRSLSGVSTFEVRLDPRTKQADHLQAGRIVMFGSDGRKAGIILERADSEDSGGQALTILGEELKGLLARRLIEPPAGSAHYYESAAVEAVMKNAVSTQAGPTATDVNRRSSLLSIVASSSRGATYTLSSRYKNLLECLTAASEATGMGFAMYLDLGLHKIVFDVIVGVNRVATQTANGRAIFSKKFKTLQSAEFRASIAAYRNLAVVAGQGQGTARTIARVTPGATPTGLARRELFVDARDLGAGDLSARGLSKLAESANTLYLSGTALTASPLRYLRDYDLGDIVTLSDFDQSADARITEVKESWGGEYAIDLTFGAPYPTAKLASAVADNTAALNDSETP